MAESTAMRRAVAYALRAVTEEAKYAGTRALARRYAALLDASDELDDVDAGPANALRTLHQLAGAVDEKAASSAFKILARSLRVARAADVTSDLGPKLLQALTALGMTVTAGQGSEGGGNRGAAVSTTFDEVRARRLARARERGAAPMDAAAP